MTTLLIIRHGETQWNAQGRIQGLTDVPLSDKGIDQAKRLATRLKKEPIAAIYTSKLSRAKDTGNMIAQHHPAAQFVSTAKLNEMNFGVIEGSTRELRDEKYAHFKKQRKKDPFHFRPEGGESPADVQKRIIPVLKEIQETYPRQTVALVCHGALNRVIMGTLLEWSQERMATEMTANTSVTILHVQKSRSKLHLFNCTEHLK